MNATTYPLKSQIVTKIETKYRKIAKEFLNATALYNRNKAVKTRNAIKSNESINKIFVAQLIRVPKNV
jgi:hypothetical protein